MTSPIRRAMSACIILIGCSLLIFTLTNRRVAYASDTNAHERGAVLFQTKGCERCHSISGVGGDRAPDLGTVGLRRQPAQIKTQILKGGHGMPPFEKFLSKDEVKDLVAFLAACRT